MPMIPFVHTSNPGKNSTTSTSKGSSKKSNGASTSTVGSGMIASTEKWRGAEADVAIEEGNRQDKKRKEFETQQKASGKMLWNKKWVDKPENFGKPLEDNNPSKIAKILEKQKGNGNYYNYVDPKTNTTVTLMYLEPTHYVPLNYPESTTPTIKCEFSSCGIIVPENIFKTGKYAFLVNVKKVKGEDKIADNNIYVLNLETKEMFAIPARAIVVREDGELIDVYEHTLFRGHKVFSYNSLKEIKGLADDPDNVM